MALRVLAERSDLEEQEHALNVENDVVEARLRHVRTHRLQKVAVRERRAVRIKHVAVVVGEHVTEARHPCTSCVRMGSRGVAWFMCYEDTFLETATPLSSKKVYISMCEYNFSRTARLYPSITPHLPYE